MKEKGEIMKLIVGLGNPTKKYQNTRHNIGFMAIDFYAKENGITDFKEKFNGLYATSVIENEKVILFKPGLFMNLSGEAILEIMNYFDIKLNDLLVIYDDMDLPFASLRLRLKGNAGGHNGMKNILLHLHSNEFSRIRIGIDRPKDDNNIDYVLSTFSKLELETLTETFKKVNDSINDFIKNDFTKAMNLYNTKVERTNE